MNRTNSTTTTTCILNSDTSFIITNTEKLILEIAFMLISYALLRQKLSDLKLQDGLFRKIIKKREEKPVYTCISRSMESWIDWFSSCTKCDIVLYMLHL